MTIIFMTFLVYAVIGWIWESFYCSFKAGRYVYRGFLLGPYCPVYGFGVVSVLLLVPKEAGTMLNLYFNIVVIVTVVEYLASVLLEKFFQMQLWDYSEVPLNIQGRVAVPVSVFWGVGCLFLSKVIQPQIDKLVTLLSGLLNGWLPVLLLILFLADVITTLIYTQTVQKELVGLVDTSDSENAGVKEYRLKHLWTDVEEYASRGRVREYLEKIEKTSKHRNLSRLVKNYPHFQLKSNKKKED